MSLLKAMVDDVFSRRDVSVHDVLTKHVNDTFRAHPNRGCRSWGLKPPDSRRHLAM